MGYLNCGCEHKEAHSRKNCKSASAFALAPTSVLDPVLAHAGSKLESPNPTFFIDRYGTFDILPFKLSQIQLNSSLPKTWGLFRKTIILGKGPSSPSGAKPGAANDRQGSFFQTCISPQ